MVSIIGNVQDEHIRAEPFPHVCMTQALEPAYYRKLADNFPDVGEICAQSRPDLWRKNNFLIRLPVLESWEDGILAPIWREFVEYHHSPAFFHDVVSLLGDHMRRVHPNLEAQLGKPLESLTVAPRVLGKDADVAVDCQFSINTPVREPSRVRGVHVDDTKKIYNAILYMRPDDDDSEGGHLNLCRFRDQPRFQKVSVPDDAVDVVDQVPYQANNLILLINSPFAVHAVTPRTPTRRIRRYLNFLAEFRDPIFDLEPYQDKKEPWALLMR